MGSFLSFLINVDWWAPFAIVGLTLWYLRWAGLRLTTPEAKLCATPSMHVIAGIGHTGPYVKTRKLIDEKQTLMARYHLELAHFRMFLDDPATTPPEECRCVVGMSVEGNQEQRDFRSGRSTTRELVETIYGDQLHGDALILPSDLAKEQAAREEAAALKAEATADEATLTMAEKRKRAREAEMEIVTFSDPGDERAWSRVRVPPTANFKYLEGAAKSFLSAWLVPRAATAAFAALAEKQAKKKGKEVVAVRYPRVVRPQTGLLSRTVYIADFFHLTEILSRDLCR